jgi:hypothetical protein
MALRPRTRLAGIRSVSSHGIRCLELINVFTDKRGKKKKLVLNEVNS